MPFVKVGQASALPAGYRNGSAGRRPTVCGVQCGRRDPRASAESACIAAVRWGRARSTTAGWSVPYHMWEFDCVTGEYDYDPTKRVPTFEVKVEGDEILLQVP